MGIWTPLSVFCASRSVDTPPWLAYKSSLRLHYRSPLLLTSSTTAPPLTPCAATISRAVVLLLVLTVFSGLLDTLDKKVGPSAVFLVRFSHVKDDECPLSLSLFTALCGESKFALGGREMVSMGC